MTSKLTWPRSMTLTSSRDTIGRITDAVVEDMLAWQDAAARSDLPGDLDRCHRDVRSDGQVANRRDLRGDGHESTVTERVGDVGRPRRRRHVARGRRRDLPADPWPRTTSSSAVGQGELSDVIRCVMPAGRGARSGVQLEPRRACASPSSTVHAGPVCRALRRVYTAPTGGPAAPRFAEYRSSPVRLLPRTRRARQRLAPRAGMIRAHPRLPSPVRRPCTPPTPSISSLHRSARPLAAGTSEPSSARPGPTSSLTEHERQRSDTDRHRSRRLAEA